MLSSSDAAQNQLGVMLLGEKDCASLADQFADGITFHDGTLTIAPKSMIAKRLKASWRYVVALKVLAVLERHKAFDTLSFAPRCTLSDISPLEHYGHLKSLALPPPAVPWDTNKRQVYDLEVLRACSELRSLSLPGFYLAQGQVDPVRGRNLHHLDISVLENVRLLESLNLRGGIVDAALLTALPGLRQLVLSECVVRNAAALAALPRLEYLNLDLARLEGDISALPKCPALTEVSLKNCRIGNASHSIRSELMPADAVLKEFKAAVKERQRTRARIDESKEGAASSQAAHKKIMKLLRTGDATNVALACEIMESFEASPRDWHAVLTPSVLKALVRRWDPDIWERLTGVTSKIPELSTALEVTAADQFFSLSTNPQNRILSSMLKRGTSAGDKFLKCVIGGLRKHVHLEVDTLTAEAANTLVGHRGWDLWVITQEPLSDEVVETLCRCLSARLHLPGLSEQRLGPRAAAAVQSRGLGYS
jgi:hypothetical protein